MCDFSFCRPRCCSALSSRSIRSAKSDRHAGHLRARGSPLEGAPQGHEVPRAKAFDGDFPASIVERESDFESDLVMRNLAVFDMAARLYHFEPANLPQRARGPPNGGLDRVLDALFRRARDLDDSVNMVRHRQPPLGQLARFARSETFAGFFSPASPTLN